jgi:uncharacterized protein with PIN domain
MLGSLARKMRIFGFDTIYFAEGPDSQLESLGAEERRIILTSDVQLFERANSHSRPAWLIIGRTEQQRLRSLRESATVSATLLVPGPSRCAACNGLLRTVNRQDASKKLPKTIVMRHRVFYSCTRCGATYWRGRHWVKLRRLRRTLSHGGLPEQARGVYDSKNSLAKKQVRAERKFRP